MAHPVDAERAARSTLGQRAAERMGGWVGSWPFIIGQSVALAAWIALNTTALLAHWDAPPFILLNLMLSFQAAFTGPILLIAANVAADRDRDLAQHTFVLDRETLDLLQQNTALTQEVHALTAAVHAALLAPSSTARPQI